MTRRACALLLAPLLLLAGLAAAPWAAASNHSVPIGRLDRFRQAPGGIEISGWVVDADTAASLAIHIYVNGTLTRAVVADAPRPDIGAKFPGLGPNHGFSTVVPVGSSPARVCVFAINRPGGPNPNLGCATFDQSPKGHLDVVARRPGGSASTVQVSGWALDPDVGGPISVHLYADGALVAGTTANVPRSDIGAAYPLYGSAHGFSRALLLGPGTHQVCAYAIDQGAGSHRHLGCRTVNVGTLPFGVVDSITRSGENVRASGWTIDPDTTAATSVEVRVNGALAATLPADGMRTTLGLYGLVYGTSHGFSTNGVPTGSSSAALVCIYAKNLELGSGTRLLGCRTV